MRILCVAAAVLVLAACGASDDPVAVGTGASEEPDVPLLPATELYEGNGTVLEEPGKGVVICLGDVAESLPPQCAGTPLGGWSWDDVEREETAAGTTWGDYHVVVTFDGELLAVVEAGPSEDGSDPFGETDFSSPCPEPEGGWLASAPEEGASQDDVGAAEEYAIVQPEYVASWITPLIDPSESVEEGINEAQGPVVYNAIFTANAAGHEAELRKVWPGPLCVVEREARSERDLLALRAEAEAAIGAELGLEMLWSDGPGIDGAVGIGVVADPGGGGQAAFDERYGPGVIRLVPALRPVTG